MAELDPVFLDGLTYPAKDIRKFIKDILTEGILTSGALAVSQHSTPAMSVDVTLGRALIESDEGNYGTYLIENDALVTKTIAASDPSNPRIDRVIAQVYDSTDIGGSDDEWVIEVLTGTPAVSPSAPALPDNALDLALVAVVAGVTSIVNANITDQRARASSLFFVDLVNAQTIAGVKTFSSFPITPSSAPTINYQVANKKYIDDQISGISIDGWIADSETWTYSSVDDPLGVITIAADVTSILNAGMRIKFTNGGNTIYGIIVETPVYSASNTIVKFLHEIDPTDSQALHLMANSAITNNYYSTQKVPYGFPLEPDKWSVIVTDTSSRTQASPVNGTWYNLGSVQIIVPIGTWDLGYFISAYGVLANNAFYLSTTLSTANNSESDKKFTQIADGYWYPTITGSRFNQATLASKTTYYINTKAAGVSATAIYNANDVGTLIIKAICAYL